MKAEAIQQTAIIRQALQPVPAILVHGWKSHPGVWKRLVSRLDQEAIPSWIFDHSEHTGVPLEGISLLLRDYIRDKRSMGHYTGPVDIVCHSMGTCIARYLLEVLDRDERSESVNQLIGIGPPNNGSAMAELFNHPVFGPRVIDRLAGVFVPGEYNPDEDTIVQQFRPGSRVMDELRNAGIREDITYRILLTANKTADPGFFPPFDGKTWEFSGTGTFSPTYLGDGIVPHSDSVMKGAIVEILPKDPGILEHSGDRYCHTRLPGNPEVVETVVGYLKKDLSRGPGQETSSR
ncbi:MAG TPA: acetyltransferase [Methanoregulaceae archaeon]|nr:acetyltransferase [Methanoregulaceae archaeon]